jgi:hypothetical protein
MGGRVWLGENDAHDAVVETVEAADGSGGNDPRWLSTRASRLKPSRCSGTEYNGRATST